MASKHTAQLCHTTEAPLMLSVERANSTLWYLIVFAQTGTQRSVQSVVECADPAYWVKRMKLPDHTVLHESIVEYDTGRARKLSSRIARIVQQKQKETV
jgi:hypothetical protein